MVAMPAISRFLPDPRLRQCYRVAVAADSAAAWSAVRGVDLYESPLIRLLFMARFLPGWVGAWIEGNGLGPVPRAMPIDRMLAPGTGFRLLAEEPGVELVAGAIGKLWEPRIAFLATAPEGFAGFAEPGYAKLAFSLEVAPRTFGGSWIGLDLRVDFTDESAWRKFIPYWLFIGRFSHLIRRTLMRDLVRQLGRPRRGS